MNIYVSNLSYGVNDTDLSELFQEFGEVSSAKVIIDRYSGQSRGFGFVEMDNEEEAIKDIDELNEVDYDGKVIVVKKAKPRENRGFNSGGGSSRGY